jgi:hypothetical protein
MSEKHASPNLTPAQCQELKHIIDAYSKAHNLKERGRRLMTSSPLSNEAMDTSDRSDLSSNLEIVNYLYSLLAEAEISKSNKHYKTIATIHRKEIEMFGARSGKPQRAEDIINPLKKVVGEIDTGIVEAIRQDFNKP